MAHTCPDCGYLCHCCGDIDDINFGDWGGCECACQEDDDSYYEDEDDWYPEDEEDE